MTAVALEAAGPVMMSPCFFLVSLEQEACLLMFSFPFVTSLPQNREELFLRALCLCHTVQVQQKDEMDSGGSQTGSTSKYVAASPDEIALLQGAQK